MQCDAGQAMGTTCNQQGSKRAAQLNVEFNLPGAKAAAEFVGEVK